MKWVKKDKMIMLMFEQVRILKLYITLNIFYIFFLCLYYSLWTSKCSLETHYIERGYGLHIYTWKKSVNRQLCRHYCILEQSILINCFCISNQWFKCSPFIFIRKLTISFPWTFLRILLYYISYTKYEVRR